MDSEMDSTLTPAEHLVALWDELERQGAVVTRVALNAPVDVLRSRIFHERRRLRAIAEREAS
jgi:hypothetical protein